MGGGVRREGSAATGSVGHLLSLDQRPRLREHAMKQRDASFNYQQDIRVGTIVPDAATLLDVPSEFGLNNYKFAILNQKTVLVEPSTRRIVEVVE